MAFDNIISSLSLHKLIMANKLSWKWFGVYLFESTGLFKKCSHIDKKTGINYESTINGSLDFLGFLSQRSFKRKTTHHVATEPYSVTQMCLMVKWITFGNMAHYSDSIFILAKKRKKRKKKVHHSVLAVFSISSFPFLRVVLFQNKVRSSSGVLWMVMRSNFLTLWEIKAPNCGVPCFWGGTCMLYVFLFFVFNNLRYSIRL